MRTCTPCGFQLLSLFFSLPFLDRKKDRSTRRNLHLAYEGMISPNSEAFTLLPPPEQRRRLQAWREKKEKLKNPNYSVNATRKLTDGVVLSPVWRRLNLPCRDATVYLCYLFSSQTVAPGQLETHKTLSLSSFLTYSEVVPVQFRWMSSS